MGRARVAMGINVSDGTPNAMLEAMVMGALPLQSDTGSTAEWITDGVNGLLVSSEDPGAIEAALRRGLTDDDLVDRAAVNNARLVEERIAMSEITPKVVDAYKKVMRNSACLRV
jgi:glycosyltransferase involved in cell wall biosynthesis